MCKRLSFSLALTFVIFSTTLSAQTDDDFFLRDDTIPDFVGITKYDAFCPILEGDSVRFCGKGPCTGWVKDYYPGTEKLIHEGGYEYGRIASSFTNYFLSGKIERSFVKKANGNYYSLQVFDSLGYSITNLEYNKTIIIKRQDYGRDGKIELDEIYDKKGKYFLSQKYYYPGGIPFSELILADSRRNIYTYKEYFMNGKLKLEGQKVRNPEVNDYFNHGKWLIYDDSGKLIREDTYLKGLLSD